MVIDEAYLRATISDFQINIYENQGAIRLAQHLIDALGEEKTMTAEEIQEGIERAAQENGQAAEKISG